MRLLLLISLVLCGLFAEAQYTAKEIFGNTPLHFYGIDFTKTKVEHPYYNQDELSAHYFPEWNILFLRDKTADLKKYFHREAVSINIDAVMQNNLLQGLDSKTGSSLDRSFIEEAINNFKPSEAKGIGVLLFAGEVKGKGEQFYGKLAFFDIGTKKLLMLKKVYGQGEGFGFRNTTAASIKHSLLYAKKKWNNWENNVAAN